MDVYVLSDTYRRSEVIDEYKSLIWTERWQAWGDFELEVNSTLRNRSLLKHGAFLGLVSSNRIMIIESVEDKDTPDGEELLAIKGRSIESILEHRVTMEPTASGGMTSNKEWIIGPSKPKNIINFMFNILCRNNASIPNIYDIIPNVQGGTFYPTGTILDYSTQITWYQSPDTLYNAFKKICELYDLGFRLVNRIDTSFLYFEVYTGDSPDEVVFGYHLDNIRNTSDFVSREDSKTVAYVLSDTTGRIVYAPGVPSNVTGFDRRVVVVNADISDDDPNPIATMDQLGREALQDHKIITVFDGEVNQYNQYVYGEDYNLGDRIRIVKKDSEVIYRRVSEHILVSDAEGIRSYPTFKNEALA